MRHQESKTCQLLARQAYSPLSLSVAPEAIFNACHLGIQVCPTLILFEGWSTACLISVVEKSLLNDWNRGQRMGAAPVPHLGAAEAGHLSQSTLNSSLGCGASSHSSLWSPLNCHHPCSEEVKDFNRENGNQIGVNVHALR